MTLGSTGIHPYLSASDPRLRSGCTTPPRDQKHYLDMFSLFALYVMFDTMMTSEWIQKAGRVLQDPATNYRGLWVHIKTDLLITAWILNIEVIVVMAKSFFWYLKPMYS